MSAEDKQKFYQDHASFLGADLKAAMKSVVKTSQSTEVSEFFRSHGEWLDEADLGAKYASKPHQLASIKENARTFKHPVRGCTMYEDVAFTTDAASGTKRKEETSAEAETNEQAKKAKKPKAEREPKERVAQEKALSDQAKEKYTKLKVKFDSRKTKLAEALAEAAKDELREYVGPGVLRAAQKAALEADAACASLAMMLEAGWTGRASEVEKECRGSMEAMKTNAEHLFKQLDDARDLVG